MGFGTVFGFEFLVIRKILGLSFSKEYVFKGGIVGGEATISSNMFSGLDVDEGPSPMDIHLLTSTVVISCKVSVHPIGVCVTERSGEFGGEVCLDPWSLSSKSLVGL